MVTILFPQLGRQYQLDVDELRSAFVASENITERVRQFRVERLDAILQGKHPGATGWDEAICVSHMISDGIFRSVIFRLTLSSVQELGDPLRPISRGSWGPRVNFDGLLSVAPVSTGGVRGYVQLFRNGIIEAADCDMLALD